MLVSLEFHDGMSARVSVGGLQSDDPLITSRPAWRNVTFLLKPGSLSYRLEYMKSVYEKRLANFSSWRTHHKLQKTAVHTDVQPLTLQPAVSAVLSTTESVPLDLDSGVTSPRQSFTSSAAVAQQHHLLTDYSMQSSNSCHTCESTEWSSLWSTHNLILRNDALLQTSYCMHFWLLKYSWTV